MIHCEPILVIKRLCHSVIKGKQLSASNVRLLSAELIVLILLILSKGIIILTKQ